jgi:translation initiation factor 4A
MLSNENSNMNTVTNIPAAPLETIEETKNLETFNSWDDIDLQPKLLRGIYAYGFEKPSPIQQKTVLSLSSKKDVIGQAQSGTGKTGAFSVGSLQRVDVKENTTQVLVLSHTHELAEQNYDVIKAMGNFMKIRSHILIGGTPVENDKQILLSDEKPHVIVGTPGRVQDMLKREFLVGSTIKILVVDEADEMLSTCFKDQVYNIFQYLTNDVQVALFSATMPEDVKQLSTRFMRDPVKVFVPAKSLALDGLAQFYISLNDDREKYITLKDLYSTVTLGQTIIYCNSVRRVQDLADAMKQDGFPVISLHSSMDKEERHQVLKDFRTGSYRALVSSDITARGINIQQVNVVINFDLCKSVHTYLHRIGRCARWGRKGLAINFITRRDTQSKNDIESHYDITIKELPGDFQKYMGM